MISAPPPDSCSSPGSNQLQPQVEANTPSRVPFSPILSLIIHRHAQELEESSPAGIITPAHPQFLHKLFRDPSKRQYLHRVSAAADRHRPGEKRDGARDKTMDDRVCEGIGVSFIVSRGHAIGQACVTPVAAISSIPASERFSLVLFRRISDIKT